MYNLQVILMIEFFYNVYNDSIEIAVKENSNDAGSVKTSEVYKALHLVRNISPIIYGYWSCDGFIAADDFGEHYW